MPAVARRRVRAESCPAEPSPQHEATTYPRQRRSHQHVHRLGFRDPPDPCRRRTRPDHGRPGHTDLPDHELRVPRHRPRGQPVRSGRDGQHLHADHEPDAGRARAAHREPRRGCRRARRGQWAGRRDDGHPQPRRGRRPHRVERQPLRRHLQPLPLQPAEARRHGRLRRGSRRPRRLAQAHQGEHEGALRGDHRQPEGRRARHRRRGRCRARSGHPAHRRQHARHALPVPATGARGRHRGALADEVHRRPRHIDRRDHRRRRHVRLGRVRQVPGFDGTGSELPRPEVLGSRRQHRLHHQGPRAAAARLRRGHRAVQLVPAHPGRRDAQRAHGSALLERPCGCRVAREAPRRGIGPLPRPRLIALGG